MLGVMAGFDDMDPTTEDRPVPDYRREFDKRAATLRLGVVRVPFFETLDAEIAQAIEAAIQKLRGRAACIQDVQLPQPDVPFDQLYADVRSPESFAHHSRWIKESPEKYQPSTRERIRQGTAISAADYAQARRQIDQLRRSIKNVFRMVDLLITPTMPSHRARIAEASNLTAVSIRNTCPFDVLGLPAISVPCGFTQSGLPIGLQISGPPFAESTVLAMAHAYEQATDWHDVRPKLNLR
jgi:aspartyl-tRNA(Asn)/glutamyl-tRNA(Gln) amidotransferase subunit A